MALTSTDLQYVFSGLLVGLLVGQTGVGGGSLMTPLLILLFGMHPATAVGTDLLQASLTKTAGSLVHGFNRTVNWRLVARLAAGSLPATAITLFVASRYDLLDRHSEALLAVTLGLVLIVTAASLLLRESILTRLAGRMSPMPERRTAILTVVTGIVIGVLVSLTSIGAGAIGVTAMLLLYPKLSTRVIVGSDIAHAVPLTLLAGIGHLIMGSVDMHLMVVLLLGSIPGVVIGSTLAAKLPEWVVRPVLALVLMIVGVRLVV